MAKNKYVGGRVIVKELLVDINPIDKFKEIKNVGGVIVERGEHEQYYHTSDGGYESKNKRVIKEDAYTTHAIQLDDGVMDIEGNNIVVIRGWDLKFVDELPKKAPKPISEKKYLKAKKIIERYEKEIIH